MTPSCVLSPYAKPHEFSLNSRVTSGLCNTFVSIGLLTSRDMRVTSAYDVLQDYHAVTGCRLCKCFLSAARAFHRVHCLSFEDGWPGAGRRPSGRLARAMGQGAGAVGSSGMPRGVRPRRPQGMRSCRGSWTASLAPLPQSWGP